MTKANQLSLHNHQYPNHLIEVLEKDDLDKYGFRTRSKPFFPSQFIRYIVRIQKMTGHTFILRKCASCGRNSVSYGKCRQCAVKLHRKMIKERRRQPMNKISSLLAGSCLYR